MTPKRVCTILFFLAALTAALGALPVPLGEIEIGLESFDGYQEGMAYLSTDEAGESLEILIAYKGFGLDTVTWVFSGADLAAMRDAAAKSAWWRSRLLEMTVDQTVTQDVATTSPAVTYAYRASTYPFASTVHVLRFVRQGRDYALLMTEDSQGAETKRSGDKTLPVFTVHFSGRELPVLRDALSEASMSEVLAAYAEKKAAIQEILAGGPEEDAGK